MRRILFLVFFLDNFLGISIGYVLFYSFIPSRFSFGWASGTSSIRLAWAGGGLGWTQTLSHPFSRKREGQTAAWCLVALAARRRADREPCSGRVSQTDRPSRGGQPELAGGPGEAGLRQCCWAHRASVRTASFGVGSLTVSLRDMDSSSSPSSVPASTPPRSQSGLDTSSSDVS